MFRLIVGLIIKWFLEFLREVDCFGYFIIVVGFYCFFLFGFIGKKVFEKIVYFFRIS